MSSSSLSLIDRVVWSKRTTSHLDLSGVRLMAERLGNPQLTYPTVHVTGTNGKGSVTTKIARTLEAAGYRVGLYTSPHISSFCERISINGSNISEQEFQDGLERLVTLSTSLALPPCFFDLLTLLAFCYFQQEKVDVAIFEVGIGGRYDPTNLVQPLVTVITSIAMDHRDYLGDTLEKIAFEKAGIIKEQTPLVIGPKARCAAIYDVAKAKRAIVRESLHTARFYDEENREIARQALDLLSGSFAISSEALSQGLRALPPCRFQRVGRAILDGAHNPDGIHHLLQALDFFYPNESCSFLVAFSKDKDHRAMLSQIRQRAAWIYLPSTEIDRLAKPSELAAELAAGGWSNFSQETSVETALEKASQENRLLVVCGTFLIMESVVKLASRPKFDDGKAGSMSSQSDISG